MLSSSVPLGSSSSAPTCQIGIVAGATVQYHNLTPSHYTLGSVWFTTRPPDLQDFSAENFEHPEDDDEEDAYEDDEYACAGFARP